MFFIRLLKYSFFLLFTVALVSWAVIEYYSRDLPNHQDLANYRPNIVTRLYASDGRLLQEYAKEHRLFVPITSISKSLISAFLVAEDKNFYTNSGLDVQGLLRAILYNLTSNFRKNHNLVGGSTITQQVVKNFLLNNEKSISRKIKEAILALWVNQAYSKDQILELYLNQIYLGARSYGVASAAVNYFNKSIDELTIEESALLASMPKAPGSLDPYRNYDGALTRRNWVIKRMIQENMISEEEGIKAINMPINLHKKKDEEIIRAHFFAEEVRKKLIDKYGNDEVYTGGLVVTTSLDSKLQILAEETLKKGLMEYDKKHGYRGAIDNITKSENLLNSLRKIEIGGLNKHWDLGVITEIEENGLKIMLKKTGRVIFINNNNFSWVRKNKKNKEIFKKYDVIVISENQNNFYIEQIPEIGGAIIVMNPHSGAIRAMSGGWDFSYSKFNRATQAIRQPGSLLKPFVFLAALENGFTPSDIIIDEPISIVQGKNLPLWEPQNISKTFLGPITMRQALEKSVNIVPIKIMQEIGPQKMVEIVKRFGINDNPQPSLSLALGATETSLAKIVTAYSMIANGGKKIKGFLIEKIQDKNGKIVYRADNRECSSCVVDEDIKLSEVIVPSLSEDKSNIVDERSAYQIVSLLEGAVARGTARRAGNLKRTIAGKTGTTNDSVDTWFVGLTPDLVVGVYLGFDNPKSLGKNETGSNTALPIAIDFMEKALKNEPDIPFRVPEGINLVKVDYQSGLPEEEKKNYIYEAFKAGTEPKIEDINQEINSWYDEVESEQL